MLAFIDFGLKYFSLIPWNRFKKRTKLLWYSYFYWSASQKYAEFLFIFTRCGITKQDMQKYIIFPHLKNFRLTQNIEMWGDNQMTYSVLFYKTIDKSNPFLSDSSGLASDFMPSNSMSNYLLGKMYSRRKLKRYKMRLLETCYHWQSHACVRLVQVEKSRQTTANFTVLVRLSLFFLGVIKKTEAGWWSFPPALKIAVIIGKQGVQRKIV